MPFALPECGRLKKAKGIRAEKEKDILPNGTTWGKEKEKPGEGSGLRQAFVKAGHCPFFPFGR
jgi:hypothetical protein